MNSDGFYFRQLLAGRDFATEQPVAAQMVNFVYLIGDRASGECVAVDPAWDIDGILSVVNEDGMKLSGVLATHYHPDHVGGDLMGMAEVEGVSQLLERQQVAIHCQKEEAEWIRRMTGVSDGDLQTHESGDVVSVGDVAIRLIHTPGHTPGSQCFLVDGKLVSGDTLFLEGCGRTDFPGGDKEEIYRSITERLAHLPDDTVLYPGHLYSPEASAPLRDVREHNHVFRVKSIDEWLRLA